MFRQTVRLKRLRQKAKLPSETRDELFFLFIYYPLNVLLIYWPVPLVVGYQPRINEKKFLRWEESLGPEKWFFFHVLLAFLLIVLIYWCARSCYHPKKLFILPISLAIISVVFYFLAPTSL